MGACAALSWGGGTKDSLDCAEISESLQVEFKSKIESASSPIGGRTGMKQ